MAIKKIDTNKYKITIELGHDIVGNRKRKTENFSGTKQEAIRREAELKSHYYHIGKSVYSNDLTFKELSELFIEKYCKPNISAITILGYEKALSRIIPIIGEKKLSKITPYVLDDLYQKLKIGKTGEELGYHSMRGFYKVINVMFNQAIRWEIMDSNPNLKAKKPKKVVQDKQFYDVEQVKKLLHVLDNEGIKYKTLITLAIDSGARRSELCALRWSDIDFDTRTMSISKSLKVIRGMIDERTTKTKSSNREIVLSKATMRVLQEYKEWQQAYKLVNKEKWIDDDNRVFISKYGGYMHPDTTIHILKKIIRKYNLDSISFHGLRHTSSSLLINSGIDPKTVSERLGHSDSHITMQIYTHAFDKSKEECANKFDEIIKST